MSMARLPPELWMLIFKFATHVPHLDDIHPPESSPYAAAPDDVSLDDLRASLHFRASVARVSQRFHALAAATIPYNCVLVTNDNSHSLRQLIVNYNPSSASGGRRGKPIHPLLRAVRHLVLEITDEETFHGRKSLRKNLLTIIYNLPSILSFTSAPASPPANLVSAYRALLCTSKRLRKLVFQDPKSVGRHISSIERLLAASPNLETLVFRAGDCIKFPYTIDVSKPMPHLVHLNIEEPSFSLNVPPDSPPTFWLPSLRRVRVHVSAAQVQPWTKYGAHLTHLSLTLDHHVSRSFVLFTDGCCPNLTHLALHCRPLTMSNILLQPLPPTLRRVSLSMYTIPNIDGADDFWTISMPVLHGIVDRVTVLRGRCPQLESVRFKNDEMVRSIQTMARKRGLDLKRLSRLPIRIEGRNGKLFMDRLIEAQATLYHFESSRTRIP
ncbi:hypothetical protein OF83DRAFT_1177979 [Amylostereum chailletii]|nr:hypothetical protein OF83DRAFT_1177979 [Amylostereum chailletii]